MIGKLALIDAEQLGLVLASVEVSIQIEEVASVLSVGGPCAPGDPDSKFAGGSGLPDHEVFRVVGGGVPVFVTIAEVREARTVTEVSGLPFFKARGIVDGFGVGGFFEFESARLAGVGWGRGFIEELHGCVASLGSHGGEFLLEGLELCAELPGAFLVFEDFCGAQGAFSVPDALQQGGDGVVVVGGNGIELVVVAAGAVDGQSKKDGAGGAHHVVEFIGALIGGEDEVFAFDLVHGTTDEESSGGIFAGGVACDLLADESIEGEVLVEGADDVVAVGPCIFAHLIHFEAVALCEANDVEPVAGPAFAEVGGVEEMIDKFVVGGGIRVGDEGVDFLRGGGQAGDVEGGSADEGSTVCFGREGESV